MLACSIGGKCRLYEVADKAQRLHHIVDVATDFSDEYPCQNVAVFNTDNTWLATGGSDGVVRLWKVVQMSAGNRRSVGGKPVSAAVAAEMALAGPPGSSADSVDSDVSGSVAMGDAAHGAFRNGRGVQVSLLRAFQGHTRAIHDLAMPRTGTMVCAPSLLLLSLL